MWHGSPLLQPPHERRCLLSAEQKQVMSLLSQLSTVVGNEQQLLAVDHTLH